MQKVVGVGMPGRRLVPALWTAPCQATITSPTTYPVPRAHTFAGRQQEKIPSGEEEAALCLVALRPMPRRLSLVWAGHSPLPVNLYCATSPPPEVGQLDRGGDELTKAGNARGITGEPPTPSR